ncbi:hypothetical protein [Ponticoccus litoralis]|uniref:Uncharacterized protein n=1 Tax=Ponticoccus litoralis TaxID=422297 RepID=A0AAW9SA04_9RHOB
MFRRLTRWMSPPQKPARHPPDPEAEEALAAVLDRDPYLCLADRGLRLVSVFDDLRYDRADMDMLNGPMRRRLVAALAPLGVRQGRGSRLDCPVTGLRLHMPKFRALGASPFDALRDTVRAPTDYAVLTPTQAACAIIDAHSTDAARGAPGAAGPTAPGQLAADLRFSRRKPGASGLPPRHRPPRPDPARGGAHGAPEGSPRPALTPLTETVAKTRPAPP